MLLFECSKPDGRLDESQDGRWARGITCELARRAKRAGRFAADAARPPPPPPKRTFAHPGGKITSNKEEATMNFLKRKAEAEQEPPAQRPAIYDEEPE